MAEKYKIIRVCTENMDVIKPLWEKLNDLHHERSAYFKERYTQMNWEKRKSRLLEKSVEMLVELVALNANDVIIGYCISSIDRIDHNCGEIESLFIEESHRNSGMGRILMENAINWLTSKGVKTQKLSVGVGNETVIDFYKQFGFYPLHVVLQKKEL